MNEFLEVRSLQREIISAAWARIFMKLSRKEYVIRERSVPSRALLFNRSLFGIRIGGEITCGISLELSESMAIFFGNSLSSKESVFFLFLSHGNFEVSFRMEILGYGILMDKLLFPSRTVPGATRPVKMQIWSGLKLRNLIFLTQSNFIMCMCVYVYMYVYNYTQRYVGYKDREK